MEETSVSKNSSKSTKTLGSAMPSGNWKKVNPYIAWLSADDAICDRPQAQKERIMSRLTANLDHLSDLPLAPSSSPDIGKLHENRAKHAFDTVLKKTLESRDSGSLERELDKDPALTSCSAKECLTQEPQIMKSLKRAGSPGPSTTKHSKNTDSFQRPSEPGRLRYMYSGESLDPVRRDSLSGSVLLDRPTGNPLTHPGLTSILDKKISFVMTSTAPSPTQPSYGCWIEPNFDWKAKGVTLTSYLKGFSLPLTNNQQSGTMVVNVHWMPSSDESSILSTSCATTSECSSRDLHSQSSGMAGTTSPQKST